MFPLFSRHPNGSNNRSRYRENEPYQDQIWGEYSELLEIEKISRDGVQERQRDQSNQRNLKGVYFYREHVVKWNALPQIQYLPLELCAYERSKRWKRTCAKCSFDYFQGLLAFWVKTLRVDLATAPGRFRLKPVISN